MANLLTTKQQVTIESLRRQLPRKEFKIIQAEIWRTTEDIPFGWIDTRRAGQLIAALIERVNGARS